MIPDDNWFATGWLADAPDRPGLPVLSIHNEFELELDIVKNKTVLTITPSSGHRLRRDTENVE